MEPKNQFISKLKDLLSKSSLASNVVFGFILMVVEKVVELEFECPCNPTWNGLFSSAFFIIPAVLAVILMLINQGCRCEELILEWIPQGCKCDELNLKLKTRKCKCDELILKLNTQGCRCDKSEFKLITPGCRCDKSKFTFIPEWFKKTVSSFVPAIVWLIILFLDGQYFTCARTDWEGKFMFIDKAAPQKWCEPISEGNFTRQERMLRSQEWIVTSQGIAMSLLLFTCVGLIVYLITESCQQEKQTVTTAPKDEIQLSSKS